MRKYSSFYNSETQSNSLINVKKISIFKQHRFLQSTYNNLMEENFILGSEEHQQEEYTLLSHKMKILTFKYDLKKFTMNFQSLKPQILCKQQCREFQFESQIAQQLFLSLGLISEKQHQNKLYTARKRLSDNSPNKMLNFKRISIQKNSRKYEYDSEKKKKIRKQNDGPITYKFVKFTSRLHSSRSMVFQDKISNISALDGKGILSISDGTQIKGTWQRGSPIGIFTISYPSGFVYKGQVKDYKHHGKGVLLYPNGCKYIGQFSLGALKGEGILYDSRNKITKKGKWIQGHFINNNAGTGYQ